MWDGRLATGSPSPDACVMTAAVTTHLVARRHLDLGRLRSSMCQSV
uniref:Uncharacterized protein n=1 Tax=uncultured Nocardioidaceae bacterium TaxID=253824 RepID=A0A6J4LK30_9ACTN|nr:MAG: hypothetical protein AVDCRST_MAG46-1607 [uncultured Nocardioidaceae bacterium]